MRSAPILALALVLAVGSPALAKKKKGDDPKEPAVEKPVPRKGKSRRKLLEGTEALEGLVTFHRSSDRLYLELPDELVGVPLGFSVVQVRGVGDFKPRGGAIETQLVTWERVNHHLVLHKEVTDFRADPDSPYHYAVRETFPRSPIWSARLEKVSEDPEPLIVEASKLFSHELSQILPPFLGSSVRGDSTILESLKVFEDNVAVRMRFRVDKRSNVTGGTPTARYSIPERLPDNRSFEVTVDFHFFRLPDNGYRPRPADERIGTMVKSYKDYTGIDDRATPFRHQAVRWDLRKVFLEDPVSPPLEPITFYLDPAIPPEWRPLIKEGATWWNKAFEKIGISDAIEVLDPPEDPEWDPADLKHSMIYWNLSDNLVFSGLAGPVFTDPRTGQALKAVVYLNGEFFSMARHRYQVYAWWRAPVPGQEHFVTKSEAFRGLRRHPHFCDLAPSLSSQIAFARLVLGARGRIEPGSSEIERFSREAFLHLVAHEVGHALGFPHNWKASLVSSWDDIAAGKVTGRPDDNPFSASVMDYNPIYLAPKGSPQGDYFLQDIGPYDELAVEYLYRPFDELSIEEEHAELDRIAARAETELGLVHDSGLLTDIDPTTSSDDLGDDPLAFAASRLTMMHEEVLPRLPELVLAEGHDYNRLRAALDAAVFSVALDYIDQTARHVGGQVVLRRVASSDAAPRSPQGDGGAPLSPIEPEIQRRALAVLDEHIFKDGLFALPPSALGLLKADLHNDWNHPGRFASDYNLGARIAGLYEAALSTLLEPERLARVLDNERRTTSADRFTLPELFRHLAETAFGDLGGAVSADRRALQRLVVEHFGKLVVQPTRGMPAEASQVAAWVLRSIAERIDTALEASGGLDGYSEAHLEDLVARIAKTLDVG